jgi:hypothetical protein
MFDGKLCCVECAKLFRRRAQEYGEGPGRVEDNDEGGLFSPEIPPFAPERCEERVRSNFYQRLSGFVIGTLVISVVLYIKDGVRGAAFALVFGAIFSCVFCKRAAESDRKVFKERKLYEQQVERFRIPKTSRRKFVYPVLIIGLCFLPLQLYRIFRPESFDEFVYSLLSPDNLVLLLVLFILNIPIFILIGRLVIGSWERYWQVVKWHFIPFHFLLRRWFDFLGSVHIEDIWRVAFVDLMCAGLLVVEYLIIKLIFVT